MANELRFVDGDLLFDGGNLAMHADCCCGDADACNFAGTRPSSVTWTEAPAGCGIGDFTSANVGDWTAFSAATSGATGIGTDDGPDNLDEACWFFWYYYVTGFIHIQYVAVYSGGGVWIAHESAAPSGGTWANVGNPATYNSFQDWANLPISIPFCGSLTTTP